MSVAAVISKDILPSQCENVSQYAALQPQRCSLEHCHQSCQLPKAPISALESSEIPSQGLQDSITSLLEHTLHSDPSSRSFRFNDQHWTSFGHRSSRRRPRDCTSDMTDDSYRLHKRPHYGELGSQCKDISPDKEDIDLLNESLTGDNSASIDRYTADTSYSLVRPEEDQIKYQEAKHVKLIKLLSRMILTQNHRIKGLQHKISELEEEKDRLKKDINASHQQLDEVRVQNCTLQYYLARSNQASFDVQSICHRNNHIDTDIC